MMRQLSAAILALVFFFGPLEPTRAASPRVDVIQLSGLIEGSFERAIMTGLAAAKEKGDEVVVIELNSRGAIATARSNRIIKAIKESEIPVVTWIGPPSAEAANTAALIALESDALFMAPGTSIGPIDTLDLRVAKQNVKNFGLNAPISAGAAQDKNLVTGIALQLPDVLRKLDGTTLHGRKLDTDPDKIEISFRKTDLIGKAQHAASQASVSYLILLVGLLGVLFECLHPSTGPGGATAAAGIAVACYGIWALQGSWLGVAALAIGIAAFAVDLVYDSLGLFTVAGFGLLTFGSFHLFSGPHIHINAWVLAFGIIATTAFLLGAMTRVLRDLRALAKGQLQVTDPHPH